jgi:hypothetical protein
MVHFPSVLELELLSDRELMDKQIDVLQVLNEKAGIHEDASDEQEFYEALKTERLRRQNVPSENNNPALATAV